MELWIRSQDKDSLVKIEKIELIYDYLCEKDIQLIHIETDKGRIGSYSTKERALEVLDEIQNILHPKIIVKQDEINLDNFKMEYIIREVENLEYDIDQLNTYVYEMPKE